MGEVLNCEHHDYIKERLNKQIEYYGRKGRALRKEYYILSTINLVILGFIPLLTLISDTCLLAKYIIAALSSLASILSSYLLLHNTKDSWLEYRSTSEHLKTELELYLCGAGLYGQLPKNEQESVLVENCEKIMETEHSSWYSRMKQETKNTQYRE